MSPDCKDLKSVAEQLAVSQQEEIESEQRRKFAGQKFIVGNQLHIKWITALRDQKTAEDQCCALALCNLDAPRLLSRLSSVFFLRTDWQQK